MTFPMPLKPAVKARAKAEAKARAKARGKAKAREKAKAKANGEIVRMLQELAIVADVAVSTRNVTSARTMPPAKNKVLPSVPAMLTRLLVGIRIVAEETAEVMATWHATTALR